MEEKALEAAIKAAGGAAVIARDLDISTQAISQWKQAPVNRVLDIERISGVSRHILRPDIYPRDTAA